MNLKYPESYSDWANWEKKQNLPRYLKSSLKSKITRPEHGQAGISLFVPKECTSSVVLIAATSASPTARAALFDTAKQLTVPVGYLIPTASADSLRQESSLSEHTVSSPGDIERVISVSAVVSLGSQSIGQMAHHLAINKSIPEFVIQHGVIVPYAPPLPEKSRLLAWSQADAEYWKSGRKDVATEVVGSQLLSKAHRFSTPNSGDADSEPVFLGQLHGTELSKRVTGLSAYRFLKKYGGMYRPHPAENDIASRLIHRAMKSGGIEFQDTAVPLTVLKNPVVGVFSTGILEAAAKGIPSWVFAINAPQWVHELWNRYQMSQYGDSATECPVEMLGENPARKAAEIIESEI